MKTTVNFRVTYDVKEQLLIEAQTERVIEIDLSQVNFRSINNNTENYE